MKIELTKEFRENKIYEIEGGCGTFTFRLWEKGDKHRVYFNRPNGKSEGYIDLVTGERTGYLRKDYHSYDDCLEEFFENCVVKEKEEKKMKVMSELKDLRKIENVGYNETLKAKTFTIENKEYVLSGGEFSASGVMNYLRPLEKVLENKDDETYKRSRSDVTYYVKNSTMAKMQEL